MSVLATFPRLYVGNLEAAIDALDASGVSGVRLRFGHATGLQLALVGTVLVLAGPDEVLEPFRSTDVTVVVDDLDEAIRDARAGGASISRGPADQAVGRNVTMIFAAGPVIEFVEWNDDTRAAAGL